MTNLTLPHLIRYPDSPVPPGPPYPTILALHGRGSHERDLIGLAPYLPRQLLWISPRGPFPLGPGGFEWYQITRIGKPDPAGLQNALQILNTFIDEIVQQYPVDPRRLYLLGFSQGSILSMSYTLTWPERISGVVAQSGYIPQEAGLQINAAVLIGKPFILTHGVHDSVLPVEWGRQSRDLLARLQADLTYQEFDMDHQISEESLALIKSWLEIQLQQ